MKKQLLKITLGQLIDLNELGYLSDKGKDLLIEMLEDNCEYDSEEPLFNSTADNSCFNCHGRALIGKSLFCPYCGNNKATLSTKEVKPVILDDNPVSIAEYAKEYPENWKAMTEPKQDIHSQNKELLDKDYIKYDNQVCCNCGQTRQDHFSGYCERGENDRFTLDKLNATEQSDVK